MFGGTFHGFWHLVGTKLRMLPGIQNLVFGDTSSTEMIVLSADPTITATSAPAGSMGFWPAGPQLYLKRDAGSTTNWYPIDSVLGTAPGNWTTGWKTKANISMTVVGGVGVGAVFRLTLSNPDTILLSGRQIRLAAGNYDIDLTGSSADSYFIYFDDASGVLKKSVVFPDLATNVLVSKVWFSGTVIDNIGYEAHGLRDTVWHTYQHLLFNVRYYSGLGITHNVQPDTPLDPGADPSVETVYFGGGTLYDEDIPITIGSAPWNGVSLGSALTYANAASLPFYYYNGSTIVRVAPMADKVPFPYTGANGLPQRNNGGTLTAATDGQYSVFWVYGSSLLFQDTLFIRPHNNATAYTTLAAAAASSQNSLIWANFPVAEIKLLYRLIFRSETAGPGYTTTHRSKLVQVDDFRSVANSPIAGVSATDHNSLSSRNAANSHPWSAITTAWATSTAYEVGNLVIYNTMEFICLTAHTSGTFLTDFGSGYWRQTSAMTQNRQDNTSAVSDNYASDSFPSVSNLQSATFTLGGGSAYMFLISLSTGYSIVCSADFHCATINCLSDTDALFLSTDAGTGIVVTKSAASNVITVKNRTGSAANIGFLPVRCSITAATAWA